jgi:hypothetical protein
MCLDPMRESEIDPMLLLELPILFNELSSSIDSRWCFDFLQRGVNLRAGFAAAYQVQHSSGNTQCNDRGLRVLEHL